MERKTVAKQVAKARHAYMTVLLFAFSDSAFAFSRITNKFTDWFNWFMTDILPIVAAVLFVAFGIYDVAWRKNLSGILYLLLGLTIAFFAVDMVTEVRT